MPIQKQIDIPPLDPSSRGWLDRLWKARMDVYSVHMKEAKRRQKILESPGAKLPNGTVVAIRLTPAELNGVSNKLAPKYAGPWVVVECFENGTTYKVRCPTWGQERQVPRSRLKILELNSELETPPGTELPRWVAPWSGSSTTDANREAVEPRVTNPEENPDTAGLSDALPARHEPEQLPVESTGITSGTGPLREGLRLTVSRKARAAPGGVYVRPRRGRRGG